jgi:rhodanese-related sulfurtransferase
MQQGRAQLSGAPTAASATTIPQADLIQPKSLVPLLKPGIKDGPLILQVGSRVMFGQAHIPGAQYAGSGSQESGIQSIESVVSGLPKERRIILYCGCCPWNRCPNVGPAYKRLHSLGFTRVEVLYLADNFGDDWVSKGYPAVKGK